MINAENLICDDLAAAGFDEQKAAEDTWEALYSSEIFIEGIFTFAAGTQATLMADAERLLKHPKQLEVVLGYFASFPCFEKSDVLLYVASGMEEFMTILGRQTNKQVANTDKIPGVRYGFDFRSPADRELAHSAIRPFIGEDIVSSLGSVAGTRRLLRPDQEVHSLAMLLRGTVDPRYQKGLVDHYLVKKEIPTDKYEFRRQFQQ